MYSVAKITNVHASVGITHDTGQHDQSMGIWYTWLVAVISCLAVQMLLHKWSDKHAECKTTCNGRNWTGNRHGVMWWMPLDCGNNCRRVCTSGPALTDQCKSVRISLVSIIGDSRFCNLLLARLHFCFQRSALFSSRRDSISKERGALKVSSKASITGRTLERKSSSSSLLFWDQR